MVDTRGASNHIVRQRDRPARPTIVLTGAAGRTEVFSKGEREFPYDEDKLIETVRDCPFV